ncbi:MAG: hypothetical protein ABIS18_05770 [Actinomycetota bacterium]
MSAAGAIINIAVGIVYVVIGTLVLIDLKRGWRTMGYSHFGVGFIALAFTCGPHHLAHGLHIAEGRPGAALDLISVLVGLPAAASFSLLRIEAFRGGRGDRFISGTPGWLLALPTLAGIYLTAIGFAAFQGAKGKLQFSPLIIPNILLVGIYATIGYFLLRTQITNRRSTGGWSLSGLSLAGLFPTCAVMHATYAFYSITGRYQFDVHGFAIDWVSVPAGLYFLWAVRALYRESLTDWNRVPAEHLATVT